MADFLGMMGWPLAASLVLAGIHSYLGIHVVERQVIFVDLALAQVAMLGSAAALAAGLPENSPVSYAVSLGFALIGAAVFSLARDKGRRMHQEAIVGIVYAVSAAIGMLLFSRIGEGDEHIRESLVGNILLVKPSEVFELALLYGGIGLFHYALRKPFILISTQPEEAVRRGMKVRFWDFLFYASFGVVVTSSARVAGVLLVFSFLVVPAAFATLFAAKFSSRLFIAWAVGVLASVLGISASYFWDYPTGASIIVVFGALMAAGVFVSRRIIR